jgi:hypothetical protein
VSVAVCVCVAAESVGVWGGVRGCLGCERVYDAVECCLSSFIRPCMSILVLVVFVLLLLVLLLFFPIADAVSKFMQAVK